MAVVLKQTGECIGYRGINIQTVGVETVPEIGYHVTPQHGGRDYATEAAASSN